MRLGELLRDGDQLRLDLFAGEPWDGQSPGALTRGRSALFLRQGPPEAMRLPRDPEQLDLWLVHRPSRERGVLSEVSQGAPSLFPFGVEV